MGPQEVYEVTGDSEAAMRLMTSEKTAKDDYNGLLLAGLATRSGSLLDDSLEDARTVLLHQTTPSRSSTSEDWILAYNKGLVLLSKGDVEESVRLAWSYLRPVVEESKQQPPPMLLELACRMGFLLLEGMLTLYPTRIHTYDDKNNDNDALDLRLMDVVLAWVTEHVEYTKAAVSSSSGEATDNNHNNNNHSPDPQLKFLLSLYQSRVNFFERTQDDASIRDKHMRSARKELKQAMEIFQHKLRPEKSDTASVGTFSSYSEHDLVSGDSPLPFASTKNHNSLSRILQGQNQAALNLKANAEQLKGNVKKSLILCGEAQSFNQGDDNNYYDAIHQNNLGIVYETSGKSHLALHAFSKAVRSAASSRGPFAPDGTATPNVTLHVLQNAAMCALKSRNYTAAYECYAIGLASSNAWRKRPRKWIRLSEACIGLHSKHQRKLSDGASKCCGVRVDDQAKGVVLTDTTKSSLDNTYRYPQELPALASPEDLKGIQEYAMRRARMALTMALKLFGDDDDDEPMDPLALQSTRLSLAYVCLEERDFKTALEYALLVLEKDTSDKIPLEISVGAAPSKEDPSEAAKRILMQRQKATARMYASEAYATLGDSMASMKVLVGDGKDDAFDRLSSDLGGVTLGMASSNTKAKSRLARAQTMVRCSASAASAALGNLQASKQLANSAQAMENSYPREGTSQARKALIYCALREGNHGSALTLLRSPR